MGKWLVLAVGIALLGLINYTIHSRKPCARKDVSCSWNWRRWTRAP